MALNTEQLIEAGLKQRLIEADVLNQLRTESRRKRIDILDAIMAHYRLPVSALYRAVAEMRGLKFVDYAQAKPDAELLKKIPQALVRRKGLLPLLHDEPGVLLATADPDDRASIETVRRILGSQLRVAVAEPNTLNAAINRAYLSQAAAPSGLPTAAAEVDLVSLLDSIFKEAYLRRSSDIHLVQDEFGLRVRLRVDGELQDYVTDSVHDTTVANGLISRIKVLANLDIAEQREPQDGGMSYYLPPPIDSEFNVRVATAPTRLGERVTMRVLGQDAQDLTLEKIGMSEPDMLMFNKAIRKPFGMILLTGPTGSGKSTTLFAALREISSPSINIMTVENPVEYVMEGVSQIQTGAKVTFASALRSLLRHDPDVLMVGEIRDEETADTALKAAMTGHLVFSTLHTNTAAGTVSRLIDIGCEPFLIGSTMNAVIAQRLVRKLCSHCKTSHAATDEEKNLLDLPAETEAQIYEPKGCAFCQGSGYRGRLGLFETLWFDEELSKLVAKGCSEEELEQRAGPQRLRPMWVDGTAKVLAGITTIAELQSVAVKRH
ncbi:GspE/PulE family protein [Methylotenera sp.]|uniref:GspE/PulE family protein n=2 Tax=Methylotenera sp. TaxID=2051956 RepID=UPI00271C4ACD|nr:GspE/PulE family protein [Methylotenera sp.]MDO9204938.1 GspE/PulE family protein [Methylotenera sp.]MDP2070503.1 GspE/PulE family protein [Methylotenera sp.]MDP2229924.1 GspE/PulE family protein [Methylotenera sp.]MDP3006104.1 GspE/PulE family protein [Methylotenera sp.]MDP3141131.1 GspE/PulE family protein [Methylotenera sp.]